MILSKKSREKPEVQEFIVDKTGNMLTELTAYASGSMEDEELRDWLIRLCSVFTLLTASYGVKPVTTIETFVDEMLLPIVRENKEKAGL